MQRTPAAVLRPISSDDLLYPLDLKQYHQLCKFLSRIPPQTPSRFDVIRDLMQSNHQVTLSADQLEAAYDKLSLTCFKDGQLDRQVDDSLDTNDYGTHHVVTIPSISACMCCDGNLTVEKGTTAFFFKHSGSPCRGTAYNKVCRNAACKSKIVYDLSYYTDDAGSRRLYTREDASFEGYERPKWFQTTRETVFETLLLIETELSLYYAHTGFLPKSRIFNATHQLSRHLVPGGESGAVPYGTSAPPPPPPTMDFLSEEEEEPVGGLRPSGEPNAKRQQHAHRYALDRRRLQEAVYLRRVAMFVSSVAPWMRSDIIAGTVNMAASMVQVNMLLIQIWWYIQYVVNCTGAV